MTNTAAGPWRNDAAPGAARAAARRSVAWPPRRVAVLRALNLGDMLCAVPAFRALRAGFPRAQITLIGLPWAADFAGRFRAFIDDFLELPGYPGFPERSPNPPGVSAFLREAHVRRFDLALQMHGSGVVANPLVMLLDAFQVAGYYLPGQYCPDPALFMPYPDDRPEVSRHLALVSFLGLPATSSRLEFPVEPGDRSSLARAAEGEALHGRPYACLHPGGRHREGRWPPEYFALVGDGLCRAGVRVVLTGSLAEADLTARVAGLMTEPALNLGGRTDLGALAALLERAAVLVSNDTGVAHVADALGTPSVVLFRDSEVDRWASLNQELHRPLAPVERVLPGAVLNAVAAVLRVAPTRVSAPRSNPRGQAAPAS